MNGNSETQFGNEMFSISLFDTSEIDFKGFLTEIHTMVPKEKRKYSYFNRSWSISNDYFDTVWNILLRHKIECKDCFKEAKRRDDLPCKTLKQSAKELKGL